MSASKARLMMEAQRAAQKQADVTWQLVRLLAYVLNMQEDHPEVDWPELPDSYSEMVWRYAA